MKASKNITKIIITRPKEQGAAFGAALCTHHPELFSSDQFIYTPLMEIAYKDTAWPSQKYDAIIVSSRHALAKIEGKHWQNAPIYCVGQKTAKELKKWGAQHIKTTASTAKELAKDILEQQGDQKGNFLYVRGHDIAFDMSAELQACGHSVEEVITYEAIAAECFSNAFLTALKQKESGVITFFSQRTAELFIKLVKKYDLRDEIKPLKPLCIAPGMVECLHSVFDGTIKYAQTPDAQGMVQALIDILEQE